MRIQHIITTQTLVLATLLAVGCSKSPSKSTASAKNPQFVSISADVPTKDLGEVEFTAGTQKRFTLVDGEVCVITPTVLADGAIQMDLEIESKTANGQFQRVDNARITQKPGQQCGILVGGMMVSLTPKMKTP